MNDPRRPPLPPGFEHANENRARIPPGQLAVFVGQWVAWTGDSTRILASGKDWDEVERKLAELGLDASQVIFEHFPNHL
jgi:hypothetical protein